VVRKQNCSSFANLWFERWLVRVCKCAAMWVGVSFFFFEREEKQNKFIQFAPTYQRAKLQLYIYLSICQFRTYLSSCTIFFTLVANGSRLCPVRDLELRLYPPMKKMTESTDKRNLLKPALGMSRC